MLIKRIISTLLVTVMLLSSVLAMNVFAADTNDETIVYEFETGRDKYHMKDFYMKGDYNGNTIDTPEERLALMDLRLVKGDLRLYIDAYSGEVAVQNIKTEQIIFTNPYNLSAQGTVPKKNKQQYLSQLEITYTNLKDGTSNNTYNSFKDCVLAGQEDPGLTPSQIVVKYIPDGLRVEYSIGPLDSRVLVPEVMTEEFYQKNLLEPLLRNAPPEEVNTVKEQFETFFKELKYYDDTTNESLQSLNTAKLKTYPKLLEVRKEHPELRELGKATIKERRAIEANIKLYCPDVSYELIDAMHLEFGYEKQENFDPLFKVALEYTLNDDGFSVRLPANGIRFDESAYRLENIKVLPYLGAASLENDGYIFYPDGSGTLISFDDLEISERVLETPETNIYDEDFGKSQLSNGHTHYEAIRYPVFGIREAVVSEETGAVNEHGFLAIIEEGEAMCALKAQSVKVGGANYAICQVYTNPRPYDTIKLSGANSDLKIVSEKKYVDDYRIRYIMLEDEDTTYVGMAKAYREYLVEKGVLTKNETKSEELPLYIETFGSVETTKRFLSIPYKTNVALTTFKDITKMYDTLSENGIGNVNFILTGYADGGLTNATIPYKIDWDSSVEDGLDFQELVNDARNNGYGVYPDFDFNFTANDEWFDGLTLSDHAVKTMEGRYASKREYSATRQTQINYYELAISPAFFSHFYKNLLGEYGEFNPQGISVSSLGTYLYSDFDEDDPYNREDSKDYTVEAFRYFKQEKKYDKVITASGNAYTWRYVDAITDIATESSSYKIASATVPFLGIVLHGYIETATSPINVEGNVEYAMLRAIENGAALKFVLSYDNTELLKEQYSTSENYSVRYDIWLPTMIEYYNDINNAIGKLQSETIEDHAFITTATRVPDADELYLDAEAAINALMAQEKAEDVADAEENRILLQEMRSKILGYRDIIAGNWNDSYEKDNKQFEKALENLLDALADRELKKNVFATVKQAYDDLVGLIGSAAVASDRTSYNQAIKSAEESYNNAVTAYNEAVAEARKAYDKLINTFDARLATVSEIELNNKLFTETFKLFTETGSYTPEIIAELDEIRKELLEKTSDILDLTDSLEADVKSYDEMLIAACPDFFLSEGDQKVEEGNVIEEVESDYEYNKYDVSDTTVVYERYSDGTEFILNFNNFAIKATVNGETHLVNAYSYVII